MMAAFVARHKFLLAYLIFVSAALSVVLTHTGVG